MPTPQTTTIPVVFKTEHKPGTDKHLRVIIEQYLKNKGVALQDGKIVI
jgi:hypothetical protein